MKRENAELRTQVPTLDHADERQELNELNELEELQELEELAELEELQELEELEEMEELAQLEGGPDDDDLEEDDEDEDDEEEDDEEEDDLDVAPVLIIPVADKDSEEKVRIMAQAADSVRAEDIVALDLRALTIISDFFLIATGKSSIQIRAIADRIEEHMRDRGYRKLRVEGYQEATWILLDYGDVVCHIMAAEQRAFYDLEAFWQSAPLLDLDLKAEPTTLNAPRTSFASLTPAEESFIDATIEDTL